MPIFISGTGTDVGKTLFSALLLARYGRELNLQYLKPVQTGPDSDRKNVQRLSGLESSHFLPEICSLQLPASPHFAAEQANTQIDTDLLCRRLIELLHSRTVVELAGGLLVPLSRHFTNLDMMQKVGFPTILVAATGLGTINHTLLSIQALKSAGVFCPGVFFVGEDNPLYADNARTICEMGAVQHLGEFFLTPEKIQPHEFQARAASFDQAGTIRRALV